MSDKASTYRGSYTTKKTVVVVYDAYALVDCREPDGLRGTLGVWVDDELQDGFDGEEFEERLRDGEGLAAIAREIIAQLKSEDQ